MRKRGSMSNVLGSDFTSSKNEGTPKEGDIEFLRYAVLLEMLLSDDPRGANEYKEWINEVDSGKFTKEMIDGSDFKRMLIALFEIASRNTGGSFSIALETYHIDPSCRDAYYSYYSRQHFDFPRRSVRLNFFDGYLDDVCFWKSDEKRLQESYLGSMVFNRASQVVIARTLLSPRVFGADRMRLRLSRFETTVHGSKLSVLAFPYRMQDGESMRCAEITILNLLCYYSNEYNDYQVVLPSKIWNLEEQHSFERVTPSRGLNYYTLTKILSQVGFFPRLYNVKQFPVSLMSGMGEGDLFRRLLHWYVESGIPVAVNVDSERISEDGHSLICIGYVPFFAVPKGFFKGEGDGGAGTKAENRALEDARNKAYGIASGGADGIYTVIQSADLCARYVTIDDNLPPYSIMDYEHLSLHPEMRNRNYAVALHNGMALDALDAHESFRQLLSHEKWGIGRWCKAFLGDTAELVVRMFMASVRGYRRFRMSKSLPSVAVLYDNVPLPHFVWVLELYLLGDYNCPEDSRKAFGEIVLDATSGGSDVPAQKIVLMRYPGMFLCRFPDEADMTYWEFEDENGKGLPDGLLYITPYQNNLMTVIPNDRLDSC